MLPKIHSPRLLLITAALAVGALSLACHDQPTALAPNLARGGGGGPSISSVDPDSAPQDTTLDVAVFGSGFDRGSRVDFALDGVVGPNIRTNSTRFATKNKLIANITITADAVTDVYDVIVTTSQGKPGMGTEMFTVTLTTTDLGPGTAFAVNELGHVVGETCVPTCGNRGFFWAPGGSMDTLGVLPGYNYSTPSGINDLDQVVGSVGCQTTCTLPGRPALWTRAGSSWVVRELPTGGFLIGSARDVNNAGQVAGRVCSSLCNDGTPVVWTSLGASMTVLPLTPGRTDGNTRAINNLGMVTGQTSINSYFLKAVTWYQTSAGAWVALELPGLIVEPDSVAWVWAYDISERDGQGRVFVAGQARGTDGTPTAVRWTLAENAPGVWQVLGIQQLAVPGRATRGIGRGVNVAGETVGSVPSSSYNAWLAVRWTPSGAGEYLPSGPASGSEAYDVNDAGWIVGYLNGRAVLWREQ